MQIRIRFHRFHPRRGHMKSLKFQNDLLTNFTLQTITRFLYIRIESFDDHRHFLVAKKRELSGGWNSVVGGLVFSFLLRTCIYLHYLQEK